MADVPSGSAVAGWLTHPSLDNRAEQLYEALMQGWFSGIKPSPHGWVQALWVLCYALAPYVDVTAKVDPRPSPDFAVVFTGHRHPDLGWGKLTVGLGHTEPGVLTSYTYVEYLGSFGHGQEGPPDPRRALRDDALVETGNPLGLCLYTRNGASTFPYHALESLQAARAAGLKLAEILEKRFGLKPESLPSTTEGE